LGGGYGTVSPNDKRGKEGVCQSVTIFAFCAFFKGLMEIIFGKIKMSWGRYRPMSQNDTGGRVGVKNGSRSVTYF
jgi:hypothetical protein